ncbi:SMI1/KNR4 family protein [Actinomadura barringtoniae]|uniref:SMI1/KNR4 family protein n=1 Tax=Actinomadura barringtoniae TaxID=1427535 RepID=A0A939PEN0_9ACTN|nr:SMI1/KNR4 family protein [Actinomadura barringtoniae]MBO2447121.1 SMI1/KNR4 family protein [Actinomadura barringtoniae]
MRKKNMPLNDDEVVELVRTSLKHKHVSPPASPDSVSEAERYIGQPLPPLLRRIYLEVANGGFGPLQYDDGVLGVSGGEWQGDWADILDVYRAFTADPPDPKTPPYLVWLYDWGCAIWTLVDCRDERGPIWIWDGNLDDDETLYPMGIDLAGWLSRALEGRLTAPEKKS